MTAVVFSRPRQLLSHGPAFATLCAGIATTSVVTGVGWLSAGVMMWIAAGLLVLGLVAAVDAGGSHDTVALWRAILIALAAATVLAAMILLDLG
jgi:hypothetical protein